MEIIIGGYRVRTNGSVLVVEHFREQGSKNQLRGEESRKTRRRYTYVKSMYSEQVYSVLKGSFGGSSFTTLEALRVLRKAGYRGSLSAVRFHLWKLGKEGKSEVVGKHKRLYLWRLK